MKKILSLFALLMTIVIGAQGSEVTDLKTLSADHNVYFEDIVTAKVNAGTLFDSDYLLALAGGCSYATNKGTDATISKLYCLRVKSTSQDVIAFKVGDACTVTIYADRMDDREPVINTSISTTSAITGTKTITSGKNGYATYSIPAAGTYYIIGSNGDCYLAGLEFDFADATTPPSITTDLPATADVTVGVAEEFSIVATGATSYQWYKDWVAIEGATSATYSYTAAAAGTVFLQCKAINSIGETSSATCEVTATMPASAPIITTNLEAAYNVIKGQTQELSIVAEAAASYQWYLDGVAVEGATTDTYTFTAGSTIGATNAVYCAAINAAGATNSATATITTVGRSDCELTNIKFSNGAYGAINNATYGDGTIAVPYIAGTSAPTVEEASINISDGATYVLSGNTLTVTAEDGTTSMEYTINAVEITPLTVSADVAETSFTEVPSWVFNLYGYDNDKGLKFAKKVDEASNMRIAKGNTRQYYFIGAAKSLTLTKKGSTRKVNVYVNGTKVISDTNNDALGAITLDETAPCMVMIESNQTGGDGGFSAYAIEAAPATEAITIPTEGVATYVTTNALDFSTQNGAFKAYVVTAVSSTYATTAEVTSVPAGTALLLKGAAGNYDVEVAASAEAPATNLLKVSDGTVTGGDDIFAYSKSALKFKKVANTVTIPAGKCYLQAASATDAIDIDFGEATAVEAIAEAQAETAAPVKVIKGGKLFIGNYNVAGQQVK